MKLTELLTEKMRKNGIIKEEDAEIYAYGIEILILKAVAVFIALIISIFLKTTLFLVVLLFFLIPIRKYAGGIHSKYKVVCLMITEILLVIAQLFYKYNIYGEIFSLCAVFSGIIVVIIKSPYESENHPLLETQRIRYKRISYVISVVSCIVYGISFIYGIRILQEAITFSFTIEFFLLILPVKSCNR